MTARDTPITTSDDIARQITALKGRLTALEQECAEISVRLAALEQGRATPSAARPTDSPASIT